MYIEKSQNYTENGVLSKIDLKGAKETFWEDENVLYLSLCGDNT